MSRVYPHNTHSKDRRRDAFGRTPKSGGLPNTTMRRSVAAYAESAGRLKHQAGTASPQSPIRLDGLDDAASARSPSAAAADALHASDSDCDVGGGRDLVQLPPNTCTRENVPSQVTFALTKMASLLQYATPGSIIAFDVDDTLIRKRHTAALLTQDGVRAFHLHIHANLKSASFAEKQALVNALHRELRQVELAEADTADVVAARQARGCFCVGLTARAPALAAATTSTLSALGISLAGSAPSSLPRQAVEMQTGAVACDGIVYCGDVDKGVVLQRMLAIGWLAWPARARVGPVGAPQFGQCVHGSEAQCAAALQSSSLARACDMHAESDEGKRCPARSLWFVDDSLAMIVGMMREWESMAQQYRRLRASLGAWAENVPCRGKLSLVCCHYSHPTATAAAVAAAEQVSAPLPDFASLVQVQVAEFISSGRVITDLDAAQIIRAGAAAGPAAAAASSSDEADAAGNPQAAGGDVDAPAGSPSSLIDGDDVAAAAAAASAAAVDVAPEAAMVDA